MGKLEMELFEKGDSYKYSSPTQVDQKGMRSRAHKSN